MLSQPQIIRTPPPPCRTRLPAARRAVVVEQALGQAGIDRQLAAKVARSVAHAALRPGTMAALIDEAIALQGIGTARATIAFGPIDRRILFIPGRGNSALVASLAQPFGHDGWNDAAIEGVQLTPRSDWIADAQLSDLAYARMRHPHVKLVSLYHPENFPLPRFALGISDMARSLRRQGIGRVSLADMQLGRSANDIVGEIARERPEIIGISATFGQHDVFERVVAGIAAINGYQPLLAAGGSLAVRNAEHLARAGFIVALGPGELTLAAIVRYFLGEIDAEAIPGACFLDASGYPQRTAGVTNRLYDDILPELDLLEETLDAGGVIQLESSRGCSYACSFCPREHKGIWAGEAADTFETILPDIARVFDDRPAIARKLFLVDEEYFGYRAEAADRAEAVAATLSRHGFGFETSSRVDQVCRPARDASWHHDRLQSWRRLVDTGLDRCLFGVESGVASILERFNKKTTPQQNILAVRMLTALGVPIRCTYITFDPLMTIDELVETNAFLGRTDLILAPRPDLAVADIYAGVHDDGWVSRNLAGRPFHSAVSYMLVSMECLIGSPYLAQVEARGLAGAVNLNMGRRDARFADPRIGTMSHLAQSWVDRNFSLDYLLKSIEKISAVPVREPVRAARVILKRSAHDLLGALIDALCAGSALDERAYHPLLEARFAALVDAMAVGIDAILPRLAPDLRGQLARQHDHWRRRRSWEHINAV